MKIAVTGASSDIGRRVCAEAGAAGHEVVQLVRCPGSGQLHFDLACRHEANLLDGIDGVIHLAWQWQASAPEYKRINVDGSRRLLDLAVQRDIPFVLLSTFSTFSRTSSEYADCKRALEYDVRGGMGGSVRAGVIWGDGLSGIAQTLKRAAVLPMVRAHLKPDPVLYQTSSTSLGRLLVGMCVDRTVGNLVLGAYPVPLSLSQLIHTIRVKDSGIQLPIPVTPLRFALRLAERAGLRLPMRSDSLGGALEPGDVPPNLWDEKVAETFRRNEDFLSWMKQAVTEQSMGA